MRVRIITGAYAGRIGTIARSFVFNGLSIVRVVFEDDYVHVRKEDTAPYSSKISMSDSMLEFLGMVGGEAAKVLLTNKAWLEERILEVGNFFSVREDEGKVSYCPAGKEQEIEAGKWVRKGRQSISPGKLLKRILPEKRFQKVIPDSEIERFVNHFKAYENKDKVLFRLVSSAEDITAAYQTRDENDTSCMRDKPVGEFYHAIGVKLLLAEKNAMLVGRALVWEDVDMEGERITFMDRIYGDDAARQAFQNYAAEQGWWRKTKQSFDSKQSVTSPQGSGKEKTLIYARDFPKVDFYPYLDTFTYYSSNFNNSEGDIHLIESNGTYWTEYVVTYKGDRIRREEAQLLRGVWYHNSDLVSCAYTGVLLPLSEAILIQPTSLSSRRWVRRDILFNAETGEPCF